MGERNKEYFTETFLMLEKLNGGMSSRWYGHIKVWRGGNKVLKKIFWRHTSNLQNCKSALDTSI